LATPQYIGDSNTHGRFWGPLFFRLNYTPV